MTASCACAVRNGIFSPLKSMRAARIAFSSSSSRSASSAAMIPPSHVFRSRYSRSRSSPLAPPSCSRSASSCSRLNRSAYRATIAACSDVSFSPTRTARPSSERSYRYRWSWCSNSAAERTAVVDIARTLSGETLGGFDQFVEPKRLRDHSVGRRASERRPAHRAGEHHDRRLRMIAPNLVEKVDAAVVPDVDIEQDDGDAAVGERGARIGERRRVTHDPALELEVDPAEESNRRVVVDNQDCAAAHHPHRGRVYSEGLCHPKPVWPRVRLHLENEK